MGSCWSCGTKIPLLKLLCAQCQDEQNMLDAMDKKK